MRIIDWEEFITSPDPASPPLALTVGVFDGVHRGHQSLIQRISLEAPLLNGAISTVVTFRQNPQRLLRPDAYAGDILTLEQKLAVLEGYGVQLTVLIDFSSEFSKISGRDFIDLLLGCRPVRVIALGRNFRCGHGGDTGADEIRDLAAARGAEVWVAPPVMDGGLPVSSSRIRQALAEGQRAEAERLLGRSLDHNPHD